MQKTPEYIDPNREKREVYRRRTLKGGKIVFNDFKSVFDCTIRNLTELGCKITVANSVDIPKYFELHLSGGHEKFQCEFIWRKINEAGVKFIE